MMGRGTSCGTWRPTRGSRRAWFENIQRACCPTGRTGLAGARQSLSRRRTNCPPHIACSHAADAVANFAFPWHTSNVSLPN
eukprot:8836798-Pyramimonas_sp.AAC.1